LSIPRKNSPLSAPLFIVILLVVFGQGLSCSSDSSSGIQTLIDQWKLEEAQGELEALLKKRPDDISARRLYARVLLSRGELFHARDQYGTLVVLDSARAASHRIELGFTLFYLGALDSSEMMAKSVLLSGSHIDSTVLARGYNLLGLIDFNRGLYHRAAEKQRQSLLAARASFSRLEEANALRQLGVLAWYGGHADSALLHFYLPALELYRTVKDKVGEATTLSNIGLLYNDRSERIAALRYQLDAFRIRKQIGDQRGLADSYYFLTATGTRGKTYGFLYTYRVKSLELSTKIGYAWGREVAARSLEEFVPDVFLAYANNENGADSILSHSGEGRLYVRWRRAMAHLSNKRWQLSVDALREVIALCDSLGYMQGRQMALFQYAQALSGQNRFAEAEQAFRQARQQNVRVSSMAHEFIDLELARTSLRLGKTGEARNRLQSLTGYLDSLYLHHVRSPGMVFSLERITEMVYEARSSAYGLLAETVNENDPEEIFQLIEQERALLFWGKREGTQSGTDQGRDAVSLYVRLMEQFEERPEKFYDKAILDSRITELQQSAILEERILTEAGKRVEPYVVPPLRKLRESLEKGEAFLQYFLTEGKVVVLVSRKERSKLFTLGMSAGDLTASVSVFRDLLLRGKETPGDTLWRSPASLLFETLLAPLEKAGLIAHGDQLIIAPHRILHLLPFPVLLNGNSSGKSHFVVQQYTVSTVPSATWFVETRSHAPVGMQKLLAAAPLASVLPFSGQEIERIPSKGFVSVKLLRESDATMSEIVRLLPQFDIAHLATHSRMNPWHPLYSFIECYDGRLELHELFHHSGPRRMMILSACESGVGRGIFDRKYTSDDIVSFPRAFIQNGVPSVISSLWLVEDESAARIFEEFYSALKAQEKPATLAGSLALAQRHFLANSAKKGQSAHPFSWASFYLFGDGR
jgi:CHAT domain-containing protein